MVSSIISNQLTWLGLGFLLVVVSIFQKGQNTGISNQKLWDIFLLVGIACIVTFFYMIFIQGVTFYSIGSIINFWVAILAMIGYFIWGATFIVVGGYLLTLFRDVLSSLNIISIPSPMSALTNFGAPVAVGLIVGLWVFEYYKYHKYSNHSRLPSIFGIKCLLVASVIFLFAFPLYQASKVHVLKFMDIYWFILFIPFFASRNISKVAKLTSILIIISLILRVYLYVDQISGRPLMINPAMEYLSASGVDNVFRLGGQTYGANNASLTLLTLIPFGLALLWESSWTKMIRPICLLGISYLIYRSDTRTTWIGFICVLLAFFLLIGERKYVLYAILGSIIAVITLPYLSSKMVGNLANTGGITSTENNLGIRLSMWGFALKNALTSVETWIIGVGLGAEPVPWTHFGGPGNWDTLHSLWISEIVHGGLVLLLGWILFFWKGLKNTFISFKRSKEKNRIWLAAGVSSWIGFFFFTLTANADWPQPTQMIVIIALNLWATAKLVYKENKEDTVT